MLKDRKKQGKYRGCLPLVHPTQLPTISQWLRHPWARKRYPDHHSLIWPSLLRICPTSLLIQFRLPPIIGAYGEVSQLHYLPCFSHLHRLPGIPAVCFYVCLLYPFAILAQLFTPLQLTLNRAQLFAVFHQWKSSGSSICISKAPILHFNCDFTVYS